MSYHSELQNIMAFDVFYPKYSHQLLFQSKLHHFSPDRLTQHYSMAFDHFYQNYSSLLHVVWVIRWFYHCLKDCANIRCSIWNDIMLIEKSISLKTRIFRQIAFVEIALVACLSLRGNQFFQHIHSFIPRRIKCHTRIISTVLKNMLSREFSIRFF